MAMMAWLLDYNCSRGGGIHDVMGYRWHEYGLGAPFCPLRMYGYSYTSGHLGPVLCTHCPGMMSSKRSANVESLPVN